MPRFVNHAHAPAGDSFQEFVTSKGAWESEELRRVLVGGAKEVVGIPDRKAQNTIGAALFGRVGRKLQTALGTGEHVFDHSKGIRPRHPLHRRNWASVTKKMEKVSSTKVNEGNEESSGHWQHRPFVALVGFC
jgi:hypothetical protein